MSTVDHDRGLKFGDYVRTWKGEYGMVVALTSPHGFAIAKLVDGTVSDNLNCSSYRLITGAEYMKQALRATKVAA